MVAPNREVFALEQDRTWAEILSHRMRRYHVKNVHVLYAPLRDYGDFSWYEVPPELADQAFGLVICDGPTRKTRGGRYGLLPIMATNLLPGCEILLDDMGRPEEQEALASWESNFPVRGRLVCEADPYAVIVWQPTTETDR